MSKLIKKSNRVETGESGAVVDSGSVTGTISRRAFLKNSSLMAGGAALASTVSPVMMKKSEAAVASGTAEQVKTHMYALCSWLWNRR